MHTCTPTLQCVYMHSSLRSHVHTERDDNISMVRMPHHGGSTDEFLIARNIEHIVARRPACPRLALLPAPETFLRRRAGPLPLPL